MVVKREENQQPPPSEKRGRENNSKGISPTHIHTHVKLKQKKLEKGEDISKGSGEYHE